MEIRGRNYVLRHTYTDSKGVEVWRIAPDDTSKDWSGHFHIHDNGLIEVQLFKRNSNIRYKDVISALQYVAKAEKRKGKVVKVLASQQILIRELSKKSDSFKMRTSPKTMGKFGTRLCTCLFEYCK